MWPGWWAALIQFVCGGLVLLGLGTRVAAIICSGSMAYAYFVVHQSIALLPMNNGGEPAALFCWSFLMIAAIGPGEWSLDTLLARRRERNNREQGDHEQGERAQGKEARSAAVAAEACRHRSARSSARGHSGPRVAAPRAGRLFPAVRASSRAMVWPTGVRDCRVWSARDNGVEGLTAAASTIPSLSDF